jgi:dihydrofolate reductase
VSLDIVLLAAVAENGVIGRDNALPWRLKSDMQQFRAATLGKPVVMGRKTFQSIGKPLKDRTTIVVSRDRLFAAPGILVAPDLTAALEAARGDALRRNCSAVVIAGGGDIYMQAMPLATELSITEVHKRADGDARFPAIDRQLWRETARRAHQPAADDEVSFDFVTYRRINAAATKPTDAS